MAKPKARKVGPEETYSPEAIEVMVDYVRGLRKLDGATKEISRLTGLLPEYARAFLLAVGKNRVNATIVRGYSKESEHTLRGKIGSSAEVIRR